MANFAIQCADGLARVDYANNTTLQNAAAIYARVRCTGDKLNSTAARVILYVGGPTAPKVALYNMGSGNSNYFAFYADALGETFILATGDSFNPAYGFDSATYYEIEFGYDPAATPQGYCNIYDTDGTTLIYHLYTNAALPALLTTAGYGAVSVNATPGAQISSNGGTYDWMKIGNTSAMATYTADMNEGTGTTTAPGGSFVGSCSWVSVPPPPDHGIITLGTNPVAIGGTGTATMTWYDATNTVISPQPPTKWSTVGAGVSINVSTGVYTGAGGGTCTIKGAYGAVNATTSVTITRRLTTTGTMTVS